MRHTPFVAAVKEFRLARQQAALEQIVARLSGRSCDLLSYQDVCRKLKVSSSASRGVRDIPLKAIVGSVGRYTDFTRSFLPRREEDRDRWARVESALSNADAWPPIEVYQVGAAYFVLDGNHRVSIARRRGIEFISAVVTEVRTKVPLSPDVQPDDLIVKAEYAEFLEYTALDRVCPGADLTVSVPGQYTHFENHIEVHRYFREEEQGREIPLDEAVRLWYNEAYLPIARMIEEQHLLRDLPNRTVADLFIWIFQHRMELEKSLGWRIGPESVATNMAARFSPRARRVLNRLRYAVRDTLLPAPLRTGPPPGQWRREHLAARCGCQLFEDILVVVNGDGEEIDCLAIAYALDVARREEGRLHGLHVSRAGARRGEVACTERTEALREDFARRCEAAGRPGRLGLEAGDPLRRVCQRAWLVDLVVLGLSQPLPSARLARLTSDARALLCRCPRPILVLPPSLQREAAAAGSTASAPGTFRRALLAYDGSPAAEEALFVAAYCARQWDLSLTVLHADGARPRPDPLERAQAFLEAHAVPAELVRASGPAAEAILRALHNGASDLLIMGSYRSAPLHEIAGDSTVNQVLRASRRPVLLCR